MLDGGIGQKGLRARSSTGSSGGAWVLPTYGCPSKPHRIRVPSLPLPSDGRIDASEIQAVVSTLVAEKFKSKAFKIGLIVLGVFTIILLGAMFGLTWAVVAALKDTQVDNSGVMTTNDGASTPVLTANLDMTVSSDGKLVSRTSNSTIATTPAVTRSAISSETSFDLLLKLRNLVVRKHCGIHQWKLLAEV